MNMSELALAMLKWEKKRKKLDALEEEIKTTVMQIGKTQTVGNVRASYSAGRKTYDYRTAALEHPDITDEVLTRYQKITYDFRSVCQDFGIEAEFKQSAPSVSLKLLE